MQLILVLVALIFFIFGIILIFGTTAKSNIDIFKSTYSPISKIKLGINKPINYSDDYRKAVCDITKILYSESKCTTTIYYDDGLIKFDCSK
jgi:hypothetical protein